MLKEISKAVPRFLNAKSTALLGLALVLMLAVAPQPSQAVIITEINLPGVPARTPLPFSVEVIDSGINPANAGVYFTESSISFGNAIGRLAGGITFTEWATRGQPNRIDVCPDGTLLAFTEFDGNRVGFLNPATNVITEFNLARPGYGPTGIAWVNATTVAVTARSADRLVVVNTAFGTSTATCAANALTGPFRITEFALTQPYGSSSPEAVASDGRFVWVTEVGASKIGKLDLTTRNFVDYVMPEANPFSGATGKSDILIDASGLIWITANNLDKLFRFAPLGQTFTAFSGMTPGAGPARLTTDGANIWFTENGGNRVGKFDIVNRIFTEYPLPTAAASPFGMGFQPTGGIIWWAERDANKLGSLQAGGPSTVIITPSISTASSVSESSPATTVSIGTTCQFPPGAQPTPIPCFATYPVASTQTVASNSAVAVSSQTGTTLTDTIRLLATSIVTTATSTVVVGTSSITTAVTTTAQITSATTILSTITSTVTTLFTTGAPIPGNPPASIAAGLIFGLIVLFGLRRLRRGN